jgi:alkanesulfonate monooxygenase SsuD/methylene tetrahydromethanopterin reductase-like flavin-dependent oxidoreductase (luciferase family)
MSSSVGTDGMRLGSFVLRPPDATEAVRRFQVAEALGYDAAFATQVNGHEALTIMAAAAVRTQRIQIGAGVIPIYMRTPATMAQSAATLWELSGGRIMLGVGLGHRLVMERWHGEKMERPVAEMREYLAIVRGILDGTPLKDAEKWASDMPLAGVGVAPEMPLFVGALSPGMLRLAGEVADGVIVWLGTPGYYADTVIPNVREGRARAGKDMEGFEIIASIPCAMTDDATAMRSTYVKQIAHNLRLPFYRAMLERGGYHDDLSAIDEVASYEELGDPIVGDAMERLAAGRVVRDIAAIGDDAAVAAKLADYAQAGVTIAGVNPVRIDDYDATLAGVAHALGRGPAKAS